MPPRHFWALFRSVEDEAGPKRGLDTKTKDDLLDLVLIARAEHAAQQKAREGS